MTKVQQLVEDTLKKRVVVEADYWDLHVEDVPELVAAASHEDERVRRVLVRVLRWLAPETTRPWLEDPSEEVREAARMVVPDVKRDGFREPRAVLASLDPKTALEVIMAWPVVLTHLLRELFVKLREQQSALLFELASDLRDTVRYEVCQAIATIDDPQAEQVFVQRLDDSHRVIKTSAAYWLARRGDVRGVDTLLAQLSAGDDVAWYVKQTKDPRALQLLLAIGPDDKRYLSALTALGSFSGSEPALMDVLQDKSAHPYTRYTAAESLMDLKYAPAKEALQAFADKDARRLHKRAYRWLINRVRVFVAT